MTEYFSDHVRAVIRGEEAPDHAVSIVFTLGRLHAALMHGGASLTHMDVAKTAVRLAMSVDYCHHDGHARAEIARYMLLEYWLQRLTKEEANGTMGGVHARPDAERL